ARSWVLVGDEIPAVEMSPPMHAAGRNVYHYLPEGTQAQFWKRLLTEAQMLIHSFAERLQDSPLQVNSLWMWGGGGIPEFPQTSGYGLCHSNIDWVRALAAIQKLPISEKPADFQTVGGDLLIANDCLLSPAVYGDQDQWNDALNQLNSQTLQPILNAWREGVFESLSVYACDGRCFTAKRRRFPRFWRRKSKATDFIGGE
ncbi:MAG: hypothetical protein AAF420_15750, partial [Pseudomonadota bacterium]